MQFQQKKANRDGKFVVHGQSYAEIQIALSNNHRIVPNKMD